MTRTRPPLGALVGLGASILGLALALAPPGRALDGFLRDRLLAARALPEPPRELLLLDLARGEGETRLADRLLALAEFGAGKIVLELPPGLLGPAGEEESVGEALPAILKPAFDREFSRIGEDVRTLFEGIRTGSVRPSEAERMVAGLLELVDEGKARLLAELGRAGRHGDRLAGARAAFQGGTWVAFAERPGEAYTAASPAELEAALRLAAATRARIEGGGLPQAPELALPPADLVRAAAGAGHSAFRPDPDGVLRRVAPALEREGRIILEASLAAWLGEAPALAFTAGRLAIEGRGPPAFRRVVPLDRKGGTSLSWPAAAGPAATRRLDPALLERSLELELELMDQIASMARAGYLPRRGAVSALEADYRYVAGLVPAAATGPEPVNRLPALAEWREARAGFFALAERSLSPAAESAAIAAIDRALAADPRSEEEARALVLRRERARTGFPEARRLLAEILALRAELARAIGASFCVVSLAPGQGDLPLLAPGRRPVSRGEAAAALVATLSSGLFAWDLPPAAGALAGLALCLAWTASTLRLKPLAAALAGLGLALLVSAGSALLFAVDGAWLGLAGPAGGLLAGALARGLAAVAGKRRAGAA